MSKPTSTGATKELSMQIDGRSRDFLRRFMVETDLRHESFPDPSDDVELSLGLSLGGRFGKDSKENHLVRSSSISGLEMLPANRDLAPPPAALPLVRACSLPTESEEEWRKRKKLQSLRRLEAKRKRSEKQKNGRAMKDRSSLERDSEEEKREIWKNLGINGLLPNGFSLPPVATGLPGWADLGSSAVMQVYGTSSRGSQGSGVSGGVSEMDVSSLQGSGNSTTEARSPISIQSLPDFTVEQKVLVANNAVATAPARQHVVAMDEKVKPTPPVGSSKESKDLYFQSGLVEEIEKKEKMERNVMDEMPCVSTRGHGPNGRRVEGFLYKYKKGEEVRIVCVCHGSFLTPAEFVRHAGGGDVAHPLRHIVVNPTPSSFL